ncbi:MAG: hypothetical protein V7K32_08310 [Nostoc sp.]
MQNSLVLASISSRCFNSDRIGQNSLLTEYLQEAQRIDIRHRCWC